MAGNPPPENLLIPQDDGAADHLDGAVIPELPLTATSGHSINVGKVPGRVVFYIYPMTGRPDTPLPEGWDTIPGARGCTPQACSFRDHHAELRELDTRVYGVSAQDTDYQREAKERLHLPFELLSDSGLELWKQLRLPTFEAAGMMLYKRITLIVTDGKILKVFYPVYPPDRNADQVIAWLKAHG